MQDLTRNRERSVYITWHTIASGHRQGWHTALVDDTRGRSVQVAPRRYQYVTLAVLIQIAENALRVQCVLPVLMTFLQRRA
jgi:hypothetical protein